jgi:hypothetical protein
MSQAKGEFHCQICKKTLSVNPDDERTFLSRTEHDQLFGMKLVTYRVAHIMDDERHVNTIILDHEGYFRGHRDSYSEKIRTAKASPVDHYWTVFQEIPALLESRLIRMAFITDRHDGWVLELVNPGSVKIRELALMAVSRVVEAEKVYEIPPKHLTVKIADHELEIWLKGSELLCVEARSAETAALVKRLATSWLTSQQDTPIPDKKMMILALRVIEEHPEILDCPDLVFHF